MIRAADSSKSAKIVLANIGNWHHIYIGIGIYVVRYAQIWFEDYNARKDAWDHL